MSLAIGHCPNCHALLRASLDLDLDICCWGTAACEPRAYTPGLWNTAPKPLTPGAGVGKAEPR